MYSENPYSEDGPIGTVTLNPPGDGNMLPEKMCHEIRDCIESIRRETQELFLVLASRGAFALASIQGVYNARHGGVSGLSHVTHDSLLWQYLSTEESKELSASFADRRNPGASRFCR